MKLNFKDLKQQKFTVDAEPSETVTDVKQKIAAEKGFEATSLKLIWSGKILQDSNTVGSYEIKPSDQIVCMVQKPKAAPVSSKAPSTPAPTTAQTPSAPAPAAAATATTTASENAPATPSPAPATTATSPMGDSGMMLGEERQSAIAGMESMGFERSQIERAMRAAFYNADRAVEYLINGIPESAQSAPPPSAPPGQNQPSTTQSQPATTTPSNPAPSAPTDEPVNLFEAAAAATQGDRGSARSGQAATPQTSGSAGTEGEGGGLGGAGGLDFLRNNETFLRLREAVHQQPQILETVLQQLSASNPQLAQLIQQNPEQFIRLLAEGTEEGEGGGALPPNAFEVAVTEDERGAIDRLCGLGFDRNLVIQAYFACDKNEELAANFLFEHPDDEGDQQ